MSTGERGRGRHAIAADVVFDGETARRGAAILVQGARILDVVGQGDVPTGVPVDRMSAGLWLAPGFIDIQVNGGGGVLFNDAPTRDGIAAIVAAHRSFGTTSLLPTLITDTDDKMRAAIGAVADAMASEPGVLGLHLEGPFLSPEKPGVHRAALIRRPQPQHFEMLTSLRGGVTLVTLAPEAVPAGFIRRLTAAGVKVSLGHSMATYAQTRAAIAEGLTGFTHLFNAMRPLESREPGPIAAALEAAGCWFGTIVDGIHVDPAMLRLALRGEARPLLVSDAMPTVGGTRDTFSLFGDTITLADGRLTRQDGRLAGAAISMVDAVRNCVELLGVPLTRALAFASAEPAAFLGLDDRLGRLAPSYRADIVAFDPGDIAVHGAWVAGERWRPERRPPDDRDFPNHFE
jgi:N-acetylglucosamine-6-phosphate deacetylase